MAIEAPLPTQHFVVESAKKAVSVAILLLLEGHWTGERKDAREGKRNDSCLSNAKVSSITITITAKLE